MLQFQGVPTVPATLQYLHQTSSSNHPRSNGFVERMVGVAKKLMDKAGKEGKPWISGLFTTGSHPSQAALHHLCN